jgi:hypothetical protein
VSAWASTMNSGLGGLSSRDAVWAALAGLDHLLEAALRIAPEIYGWEPGTTSFRGLYITPRDAERIARREAGVSPFGDVGAEPFFQVHDVPPLASLAERYGLSWFDCAVILIALAPEADLRYERLYAYLQDDVARRRPTVDLILNLLCPSAPERLDFRVHFAPNAVLLRHRLIRVTSDPNSQEAGLLASSVKLDEQITRELLDTASLDSRLGEVCALRTHAIELASLPLEPELIEGLRRLAMDSRTGTHPLRICLNGPELPLRLRIAEAIAGELGRPLLTFDLRQSASRGLANALQVAVREARFINAVFFAECDGIEEHTGRALADELSSAFADAILAASAPAPFLEDAAVITIELSRPSFAVRREQWRRSLAAERIDLAHEEIDSLALRFRLHADEIISAVLSGRSRSLWRGSKRPSLSDFSLAARALSGRHIGSMARKIEPRVSWTDIVLPTETTAQMRAICARVVHQHRVLEEWGFDRKLSNGKGVTALFAGPSGVGKTMAAEVIASELDIDLYKIDLSSVVSKYIGETEKNLDRIFNAAENANAILFFDEADALFGKRSEVKDSHDRYANIEISYLLQKMEMYDGVAILATNLRQNLDEAFLRRLAFTVHFPFPSLEDRKLIWQSVWPSAVPLDPGADFEFLASSFKLSGGNIKNIALSAAFLAVEENRPVSMHHLLTALDREYQKMGKPLSPNAFGPYATEAAS